MDRFSSTFVELVTAGGLVGIYNKRLGLSPHYLIVKRLSSDYPDKFLYADEMVNFRKNLLVLDINGLLLDTYYQGESRPDRPHDAKVNKFYVYKRAFCDEFIQFCLQNFIVGVWSSAREHNVVSLVEFIFKESKGQLAFIWHQLHCTDTGFKHPENKYKPVFLKELSKLWENYEHDLPWARGDYGPSNTLLIDDSPYKATSNPRHTGIFPKTYKATDPEDKYLAGELLPYLEGLLKARDVQTYLARNPTGEPSINPSDPQWSQILNPGQLETEEETVPAHLAYLMGEGGPLSPYQRLSSQQWTTPDNPLPVNRASPAYIGAQSQFRDAATSNKRLRRSDPDRRLDASRDYNIRAYGPEGLTRGRTPEQNYDSNWGKYGREGLTRGRTPEQNYDSNWGKYGPERYVAREDFQRATGPSRPSRHMSRDTSEDLVRRHAMRSADNSRGADWTFNGDYQYNRRDDWRKGSFRDANRSSVWSEEPEPFFRDNPWDDHRGSVRDHEGSYHFEGQKRSRLDWPTDPRGVRLEENRVTRKRDRSREKEFEGPHSFQPRASERHDHRRDESRFRSKSRECRDLQREGRDLQRYADREKPRRRDLSEDSGRHSQKHENSNDRGHSRGRKRSGWKD